MVNLARRPLFPRLDRLAPIYESLGDPDEASIDGDRSGEEDNMSYEPMVGQGGGASYADGNGGLSGSDYEPMFGPGRADAAFDGGEGRPSGADLEGWVTPSTTSPPSSSPVAGGLGSEAEDVDRTLTNVAAELQGLVEEEGDNEGEDSDPGSKELKEGGLSRRQSGRLRHAPAFYQA